MTDDPGLPVEPVERWAQQRPLALIAIILLIDATALKSSWLPLHGLADEVSNVLNAALWLAALSRIGVPIRMIPGLLAAVAIDLDHVPEIIGLTELPEGSSRPFTHSLCLVGVVLIAASLDRRRRVGWASAAIRLLSHLVRDLGTGAVFFWWTVFREPVSMPYLASMLITSGFVMLIMVTNRRNERYVIPTFSNRAAE